MTCRKNTLLLMSKLPEPGRVKTRLTTGRGGRLTPEAACVLYHCMLLDVVEVAMAALDGLEAAQDSAEERARDAYGLVVATPDPAGVPLLRELVEKAGSWPRDFDVLICEGGTFGESLDHAIGQCFARGADCVLCLRGDCPAITTDDVQRGFRRLHELAERQGHGIVIAPDHKMGVSIVGLTREARFTHEGVFGNPAPRWALTSYIAKAAERGLPVLCLPPVPDVDTMDDLVHVATLVQALNYCAAFDDAHPPWRTAAALYKSGFHDAIVRPGDSAHSPAP